MSPAEVLSDDLAEIAQQLRARNQPFAFATIVRTAGATAAKPGAKALLSGDGDIVQGWLGGGCTRSAVKRMVLEALESGKPQLVSVAPEDLLAERGLAPGMEVDGTQYERNGCPSRGSVDIFIEPCLPAPELVILGTSPVAEALGALGPQFHWAVKSTVPEPDVGLPHQLSAIVIATQGQGDLDALARALAVPSAHVAFVGSKAKFAALAEKLARQGGDPARIAAVKAPAGLDIGAVTPEEIALSIMADLIQVRRRAAKRSDV